MTITAPSSSTVWTRESCASPVPGGHVHDHQIERPPVDLLHELLQDARDERAAHDGGLLALQEQP